MSCVCPYVLMSVCGHGTNLSVEGSTVLVGVIIGYSRSLCCTQLQSSPVEIRWSESHSSWWDLSLYRHLLLRLMILIYETLIQLRKGFGIVGTAFDLRSRDHGFDSHYWDFQYPFIPRFFCSPSTPVCLFVHWKNRDSIQIRIQDLIMYLARRIVSGQEWRS